MKGDRELQTIRAIYTNIQGEGGFLRAAAKQDTTSIHLFGAQTGDACVRVSDVEERLIGHDQHRVRLIVHTELTLQRHDIQARDRNGRYRGFTADDGTQR